MRVGAGRVPGPFAFRYDRWATNEGCSYATPTHYVRSSIIYFPLRPAFITLVPSFCFPSPFVVLCGEIIPLSSDLAISYPRLQSPSYLYIQFRSSSAGSIGEVRTL